MADFKDVDISGPNVGTIELSIKVLLRFHYGL